MKIFQHHYQRVFTIIKILIEIGKKVPLQESTANDFEVSTTQRHVPKDDSESLEQDSGIIPNTSFNSNLRLSAGNINGIFKHKLLELDLPSIIKVNGIKKVENISQETPENFKEIAIEETPTNDFNNETIEDLFSSFSVDTNLKDNKKIDDIFDSLSVENTKREFDTVYENDDDISQSLSYGDRKPVLNETADDIIENISMEHSKKELEKKTEEENFNDEFLGSQKSE